MKAAATESKGIWSMFGTHVVVGRAWGTDAVSLRDICRWTMWKRLIAEREGDGNWVLGKVLIANFSVSNAVSHPILLHTCCDCTCGDNVEFHNIKLQWFKDGPEESFPPMAPATPLCPLCQTWASLSPLYTSLHRKSINL